MLELRAINLDHRPRVPKKDLRSRFHNPGLSRACRPQKQQVPYRASRRVQSGTKHLEHVNQGLHALFLPDDLSPQRRVKITRVIASDAWIQLMANGGFHFINSSPRLTPPNA